MSTMIVRYRGHPLAIALLALGEPLVELARALLRCLARRFAQILRNHDDAFALSADNESRLGQGRLRRGRAPVELVEVDRGTTCQFFDLPTPPSTAATATFRP